MASNEGNVSGPFFLPQGCQRCQIEKHTEACVCPLDRIVFAQTPDVNLFLLCFPFIGFSPPAPTPPLIFHVMSVPTVSYLRL